MSLGEDIVREQQQLLSQQANFRRYWEEIAYYCLPPHATFLVQPTEGLKRTERLFDATASSALNRFAAAIEQMLTPRSTQWHKFATKNQRLGQSQRVQAFFEQLTQVLFALRYRPKANFASQTHENYLQLGAFGNMALFVDEEFGSGLRYRAIPMQELTWAQDHQGRVDTVYRRFKLQGRQVEQMFPDHVPTAVLDGNKTNRYAEHEFIHCVRPNKERDPSRKDFRGMRFQSVYVCVQGEELVEEGGYRTFPYAIGRYSMAPRENYGRSPAMECFPAIRTLNEEKKSILRAGQKAVDPPILATEEGVLEAFNMRSAAINYGALASNGDELVKPLQLSGQIPLGLELMNIEKGEINDAFLVSLFQILVENPNMTATEALIRAQEKGTMLAPTGGRQQSEYLGPLIERELDLCYSSPSIRAMLPEMPREFVMAGAEYDIEYQSTLTRSMRAVEGTAIMQTIQAVGVLAQIKPEVTDLYDFDATAKRLGDINGFPADCLNDEETVLAQRQQRAKQQAVSAVAAHAPGLSMAAKNLADAQQASASAAATGAPAALSTPQAGAAAAA